MAEALHPLLDKVWRHCEATGIRGRTATLKFKYADFVQVTHSVSGAEALGNRAELERAVLDLLAPLCPVRRRVRLLGVSVSVSRFRTRPGR